MVDIRRAGPDDVDAIAALGARVTHATYLPISDEAYVRRVLETWWTPDAIRDSMQRTVHHVAVVPGTAGRAAPGVVGTSVLGRLDDVPVLWKLYVDVDHHGTGVGTRLLDAALEHVLPTDTRVRLSYLVGNDHAAEFYRRRGFVETGRGDDPLGFENVWMSRPLG